MTNLVQVKQRGTITLPKPLRSAAGIKEGDQMLVEVTKDGILLKPVTLYPVELYTEARIKEFMAAEKDLAGYKFR